MHDGLERLITDNPSFHRTPDGATANWSLTPDALRAMSAHLRAQMRTLETGAGHSTVLFLLAGCDHTVIALQADHVERAAEYARSLGAPGSLTREIGSSDVVLPRLVPTLRDLDFVLIDGAHRFPFPAIDWHYTAAALRIGGVVAVDDYTMPSVRILHDFLVIEDEWKLLQVVDHTSFFQKLGEPDVRFDCQGQRFNQQTGDFT